MRKNIVHHYYCVNNNMNERDVQEKISNFYNSPGSSEGNINANRCSLRQNFKKKFCKDSGSYGNAESS